jgi:hypothetical protein
LLASHVSEELPAQVVLEEVDLIANLARKYHGPLLTGVSPIHPASTLYPQDLDVVDLRVSS